MNLAARVLHIAEVVIKKMNNAVMRMSDHQFRELERWYKEDPYDFKKSSFDFLNQDSVVFDLGGYLGQWSSDIAARYNCNIYIFEPVKEYAELIQGRFSKNQKIQVFQKGLAPQNTKAYIKIDKFASRISEGNTNTNLEPIELEEFNAFLLQHNINQIDLIKINIEGAEFDLLDHMIATNTINSVKALLIQFHNFVDNHQERRNQIGTKLAKTHQRIFDYPFVWELWIRS